MKHTHMYASMPLKMRRVGYWLLMLKPGESMDLSPQVFRVRAETLQTYVHHLSGLYGRKYRTYGGLTRKPDGTRNVKPSDHCLRVHFLGNR